MASVVTDWSRDSSDRLRCSTMKTQPAHGSHVTVIKLLFPQPQHKDKLLNKINYTFSRQTPYYPAVTSYYVSEKSSLVWCLLHRWTQKVVWCLLCFPYFMTTTELPEDFLFDSNWTQTQYIFIWIFKETMLLYDVIKHYSKIVMSLPIPLTMELWFCSKVKSLTLPDICILKIYAGHSKCIKRSCKCIIDACIKWW